MTNAFAARTKHTGCRTLTLALLAMAAAWTALPAQAADDAKPPSLPDGKDQDDRGPKKNGVLPLGRSVEKHG